MHLANCEEANIRSVGQLLRHMACVGGGASQVDHGERIGYQRFVRDKKEKGRLLKNGDLCYFGDGYTLYCSLSSV